MIIRHATQKRKGVINMMNCMKLENGMVTVNGFGEALRLLSVCFLDEGVYAIPDRNSENPFAINCHILQKNEKRYIDNLELYNELQQRGYKTVYFLYIPDSGGSYISY